MTVSVIYHMIGIALTKAELFEIFRKQLLSKITYNSDLILSCHEDIKFEEIEEQIDEYDFINELQYEIDNLFHNDIRSENYIFINPITHDLIDKDYDIYVIGKISREFDISNYKKNRSYKLGYSINEFLEDKKYIEDKLKDLNITKETKLYYIQDE